MGTLFGADTGATTIGFLVGVRTGSATGMRTGTAFGIDTGTATGATFGTGTGTTFGVGTATGATFGTETGTAFGVTTGVGTFTGALTGACTGGGFDLRNNDAIVLNTFRKKSDSELLNCCANSSCPCTTDTFEAIRSNIIHDRIDT